MTEKIEQYQPIAQDQLRDFALQLVVQIPREHYSKQQAHAVVALLHELIEWKYGDSQPARVFRVV